jgi:hypothetical protein
MSALILKAANEFSTLFLGTTRSDDSAGDRLSYRYTCAILIAFTVIVSNREFTSKRIQCWVYLFLIHIPLNLIEYYLFIGSGIFHRKLRRLYK